jgi:hypothetical protein
MVSRRASAASSATDSVGYSSELPICSLRRTGFPLMSFSHQRYNRFLVVCALVSDLYCPGYNPRQSLAKDSNLARAALRYKIDSAKVAAAVRTELSKPEKKKKSKTDERLSSKS